MKRLNFNIQESQYDWLSGESERLGVSISEIIRRAIEHFIDSGEIGDSVAGWNPELDEEMSFEEEVVHRLAMLEGMMLNLFPEPKRQHIYDYGLGYADATLGFPLDDDHPLEDDEASNDVKTSDLE